MGVVREADVGDDGTSTFAKLTLSYVELRRGVVGGRAVDCIEVAVVGPVLNLDGGGGRRLGVMAGRKDGQLGQGRGGEGKVETCVSLGQQQRKGVSGWHVASRQAQGVGSAHLADPCEGALAKQ